MILLACAPATRLEPPLELTTLPAPEATRLSVPFQPAFDALGIELMGGEAYKYLGNDPDAFLRITDRFYTDNPGFCPLAENAFQASDDQRRFATIAAKGLEVRAFVYDLSARPNLTFAYLKGSSREVLKVKPCRTAGMSLE